MCILKLAMRNVLEYLTSYDKIDGSRKKETGNVKQTEITF